MGCSDQVARSARTRSAGTLRWLSRVTSGQSRRTPVSCAAALANLEVHLADDLPGQSARKGEALMARFRELQKSEELIGDVRGLGLMVGVELVGDRDKKTPAAAEAAAVRQYCLENGVLVGVGGNFGNVLRVQPPLIISEAQLDRVFETIVEGLAATRA